MTEQDAGGQDSHQKARMLQDMLLDALHAMRSLEEVEGLEKPAAQERTPEGLIDRLASLTGSALRFGVKATDTSLRVGRALINSQDQLRAMLTAGQSLKDIREVAGLTVSEMSEALNLRDKSVLEAIENGTTTLSFELILRLAALIARNDPIPFIMRTTRNYNPEVWQILNDWGVVLDGRRGLLAQDGLGIEPDGAGDGPREAPDVHVSGESGPVILLDGLDDGLRDARHPGHVLDGHAACLARLLQCEPDALHDLTVLAQVG